VVKSGGTPDPIEPVERIHDPDRRVELVSYNMERFARDCVTAFCELSGYAFAQIGTAPTPFLDESNDPLIVIEEPEPAGAIPPQGGSPEAVGPGSGTLYKIACRVLMKIMYIARFARPDLLRAVGALSTMITKMESIV